MNITLDDASPQFQWLSQNDTWLLDHTADPMTPQYFKGTFHGTFSDGDAVQLKFKGSAVYIYGAMRSNHGLYSAQLDGGNLVYQLGYSASPAIQALLYSQAGLNPIVEHTVALVNLPSQTSPPGNATLQWWFDIDYAVVTVPVKDAVYTTTFDDTSTYLQYSGTGWAATPPLRPEMYYNTTAHISGSQGDAFSLKFNGSSIQLFGGLYKDHGNYTVSLDGQPQGNYNGTWFDLAPGTCLFLATGLEEGPHEIMVTNIGQGPGAPSIRQPYPQVPAQVPIRPERMDVNSNASGDDTTNGSEPNVGAIAGGVAGAIALILLALAIWWLRRRKRNQDGYHDTTRRAPVDLTGEEVKPYAQPDPLRTPHGDGISIHPHSVGYSDSMLGSSLTAPRITGHPTGSSYFSAIPPPPPSNATSYPHSINPPSSVGQTDAIEEEPEYANPFTGGSNGPASAAASPRHLQTTFAVPVPGVSSVGSESTGTPSVSGESTAISHAPKASGVILPFTAQRPLAFSSDSSELSSPATRMQRSGRETDMGPMALHEEDEDEGHMSERTLPPDYVQATRPHPHQRPV